MSLTQNLVSGEKVLWQGAPGLGIRFRRMDALLIPFGLFFFGFALFWETIALTITHAENKAGVLAYIFPVFGVPFIVIGFYLMIGRFFWDAYARKHSAYLLTNRRALIETSALGKKLTSVTLADLDAVGLLERNDGSGTVILGRDVSRGIGQNTYTKRAPHFEFIIEARRVYKLVEEARTKRE